MDTTTDRKSRVLPEGSFCGAGIESLRLPPDFNFIGPMACENCKRLIEVDIMNTDVTAIRGSTFSYCVALVNVWLPPRIQRIGKEAFLCCTSLRELVVSSILEYIVVRAFFGCEHLTHLTMLNDQDTWGDVRAEDNAFLLCDQLEREAWLTLLPPNDDVDSDAFDEELRRGLH